MTRRGRETARTAPAFCCGGTTVAVLEAPAELTGADTLEKLWTRLQLEGKAA